MPRRRCSLATATLLIQHRSFALEGHGGGSSASGVAIETTAQPTSSSESGAAATRHANCRFLRHLASTLLQKPSAISNGVEAHLRLRATAG